MDPNQAYQIELNPPNSAPSFCSGERELCHSACHTPGAQQGQDVVQQHENTADPMDPDSHRNSADHHHQQQQVDHGGLSIIRPAGPIVQPYISVKQNAPSNFPFPNFYSNSPYSSTGFSVSGSQTPATPMPNEQTSFVSPSYGVQQQPLANMISPTFDINFGILWPPAQVPHNPPTSFPYFDVELVSSNQQVHSSYFPAAIQNLPQNFAEQNFPSPSRDTCFFEQPTRSCSTHSIGVFPSTGVEKAISISFKKPLSKPTSMTRSLRNSHTKRAGGRKPRDYDTDLTDEEREKRAKRRLRNKEAAARCRKRRIDLLQQLEAEVKELKDKNDAQEQIIVDLKIKQNELFDYLRKNNVVIPKNFTCDSTKFAVRKRTEPSNKNSSLREVENDERNSTSQTLNNISIVSLHLKDKVKKEKSPKAPLITSDDPLISESLNKKSNGYDRPTSLPLNKSLNSVIESSPGGIQFDSSMMTTPTTGLFTPGILPFDNCMNGRTYLTPTVNGPTLVSVSSSIQTPISEFKNL